MAEGQGTERTTPNAPITVEDGNFDQLVNQYDLMIIDCWAPWCGPCLMVAPIVDELAEEYDSRINFVKLDVDQNPKTAAKYNIMSIPTLLIFKNGEPISHIVGARPKGELKESLEAALE